MSPSPSAQRRASVLDLRPVTVRFALVALVLVAAGCSRARQLARSSRRVPRAGRFGGTDLAAGRRAGAPLRKRQRRSPAARRPAVP
jgi:hypothetical protein